MYVASFFTMLLIIFRRALANEGIINIANIIFFLIDFKLGDFKNQLKGSKLLS